MPIDEELRQQLLVYQKNEVTEHHIYTRLAGTIDSPENQRVLKEIADDEMRHYHQWKKYTQEDVDPDRIKVWFYVLVGRILGFTFGVKLMERGEEDAQENYGQLTEEIAEAEAIVQDENDHEEELLTLLNEERLQYAGSIVLGLNDALVELTGALAGLTLAFQDTELIALSGSVTGIAAALSMGASEYLSTKSEETEKHPVKASLYTGTAYMITVVILILPYLLLDDYYVCLALTLLGAVSIVALFNYYISVAKDEPFKERFFEMAGLSLSVAALSFGVGFVIRRFLGVDV